MKAVPGATDSVLLATKEATKTAYSQSFRIVFLASIAFGGLAIIAALVSVPIDQHLDNVVAAKLAGSGESEEALQSNEKNGNTA